MACKNKKLEEEVREQIKSADLSGVAIDRADDNDVDSKLVKERTSVLDNNPRDTDDIDM